MYTIRYFSIYPKTDNITGGQVYDTNLLSVINSINGISAIHTSIGPSNHSFPLWKAPLVYLKEGLKQKNCDTIIINSSFYMRFMLLMLAFRIIYNKKIMVVHHHFMYRQFSGLKRWIYKQCEWRFLKLATQVISPSPYVYKDLSSRISKTKLIYWRIPFEKKPLLNANPVKGNLTYMGTIEPRKGIHLLLESIRIIHKKGIQYELTIIGKTTDQGYRESLDNFIKLHSLNVKFTGFISKEEKEKILAETDVFVFPSLLEGFGMVLVEAQTYGLPIVCFNNSAMPYSVFDNQNGFTVPNKNTSQFADAIIKITTNRNLRHQLSEGALQNAQRQQSHTTFAKEVKDYFSQKKHDTDI